jgi:Ice-binding-like
MKFRGFSMLLLVLVLPFLAPSAYADPTIPILQTAASFAVLAGSAVTNTGSSVITAGDVGVSPLTAITGFPPGMVTGAPGTIHSADGVAQQAQTDLTTAYNTLAGEAVTKVLTGTDLGGLTLIPGVYFFAGPAQLTGKLTLNAQGNANAFWVFQIGSTLTTASASSVVIINQAAKADNGLFWQVGSSAMLGTTTDFEGNIVALTSITLGTGATDDCGRLLARNGAVTLDDNTISIGCTAGDVAKERGSGGLSGGLSGGGTPPPVPEPGTLTLAACGIFGLLVLRRLT